MTVHEEIRLDESHYNRLFDRAYISMILQILIFVISLFVLCYGADILIRNASLLAKSFHIKPMVIGLTLVAFGTSAPEFGVSFTAALTEAKSIALGNIVGSNIANIGLILGLASLIRPLNVERKTLWREVPAILGTALLLWILSLDGVISRIDGCILLMLFALFLFYTFRTRAGDPSEVVAKHFEAGSRLKHICLAILGLAFLFGGGTFLVRSAVYIAKTVGISELVIGLTVVSVGTSLPELATTVAAALRRESDIGVGNIVGSNIFNTFWVIGCTVLVTSIVVEPMSLKIDMPAMILISLLLFPFFKTGLRISRLEGSILLLFYCVYIVSRFVYFTG